MTSKREPKVYYAPLPADGEAAPRSSDIGRWPARKRFRTRDGKLHVETVGRTGLSKLPEVASGF